MKFDISVFIENLSRKFKFHYNLTTTNNTLHADQYTFLITFCSVLLIMWIVSDKYCRDNQNTHFMFYNVFFLEIRAVYEIMWKNIVERGRPHMTIRRMRIACWIT